MTIIPHATPNSLQKVVLLHYLSMRKQYRSLGEDDGSKDKRGNKYNLNPDSNCGVLKNTFQTLISPWAEKQTTLLHIFRAQSMYTGPK